MTMKREINRIKKLLTEGSLTKRNGERYSEKTVAYYNLVLSMLVARMDDFEIESLPKDKRVCRNFLNEWVSKLRKSLQVESSSVESYISALKWAVSRMKDVFGYDLDMSGSAWKTSQKDTPMVIPEHERVVKMIREFKPEGKTQQDAFRYMVAAAITGARYSDIKSWTSVENIVKRNGIRYLVYVPQKTKRSEICIPIGQMLENVFSEGKLLPKINYHTLLRTVKEIFRLSGFDKQVTRSREIGGVKVVKRHMEYELMGLHRLRASAITSMLQAGLSETEVKSFSGHSLDSKSFKRYVRFSQKHLDEKFEKFQSMYQ